MSILSLLKPYTSQLILGATGLFAILLAYFRGREGGAAKGAKMVADTAKKAIEAELKAREVFDVKKQNILDESAKAQAILDSRELPDSWPSPDASGVRKIRINTKKPASSKLPTNRK